MAGTFEVCGEYVLVKQEPMPDWCNTTIQGDPTTAQIVCGIVTAAGPDATTAGVGDWAIFPRSFAAQAMLNGSRHFVVRDYDIAGIVRPEVISAGVPS